MLTKPKSWSQWAEHNKISVFNPKDPCGAFVIQCTFGVGANFILGTLCDLWVHNKFSGKTDHLTDNRNFVCCKCSREIVPVAIGSFKELNTGNQSFHVESTFKCLGDMIGQ